MTPEEYYGDKCCTDCNGYGYTSFEFGGPKTIRKIEYDECEKCNGTGMFEEDNVMNRLMKRADRYFSKGLITKEQYDEMKRIYKEET